MNFPSICIYIKFQYKNVKTKQKNKFLTIRYLLDRVVISSRLCYVDETECVYLAANTPSEAFIFELRTLSNDGLLKATDESKAPGEKAMVSAKWIEVFHSQFRNYTAVQRFAVVGMEEWAI